MDNIISQVTQEYGNQMARILDQDIIYGCDESANEWAGRHFIQDLEKMRPKWMPNKIWVWLHKEVL